MTKTTEELKREMYKDLKRVGSMVSTTHLFKTFEESLEEYLEELRKDLDFACKSMDLTEAKLRKVAEERDELRNKLQAFEFANKSTAELLSEALRKLSELRKLSGSTSAQSETGNVVCAKCAGTGKLFAGMLWGEIGVITVPCDCRSQKHV
jgi:uncharacterized coiled-coil DUF342 family protein